MRSVAPAAIVTAVSASRLHGMWGTQAVVKPAASAAAAFATSDGMSVSSALVSLTKIPIFMCAKIAHMSVRRVVTGVDDQGRSTFLSDGDAFGGDAWAEVWVTDPAQGMDAVVDPRHGTMVLEPPPGGTAWRVFQVPPDTVMREAMANAVGEIDGLEADGFHTTQTVDYVMVLEGEVALELDTGEVTLGPGDCVVQRGTRHAWRNRSDQPVKMVAVMLSTRG